MLMTLQCLKFWSLQIPLHICQISYIQPIFGHHRTTWKLTQIRPRNWYLAPGVNIISLLLKVGSWNQSGNNRASPSIQTAWRIIDSTLTWTTQIDYITKKATKRLYFLKILNRAGLPLDHLLRYYTAVIRPVLEYCCCVWHHNILSWINWHYRLQTFKNEQWK